MPRPSKDEVIPVDRVWTVIALLRRTTEVLRNRRIESPRLTTELLLSHLLGCERIDLYLDFDKVLQKTEVERFSGLLSRRLSHEPVQYIVGEAGFMGLRFWVDDRVLIPRPETEVLVEQVLDYFKERKMSPRHILDIGVGSGNISVSLARYLPESLVVGMDVSREALEVASRNVSRYELAGRVGLIQADIFQKNIPFHPGQFQVIVSNPPYISRQDFSMLEPEIALHEPTIAATDKGDGLSFFGVIGEKAQKYLAPDGILALETGYNQSHMVSDILKRLSFQSRTIVPDYAGIGRVVVAVK